MKSKGSPNAYERVLNRQRRQGCSAAPASQSGKKSKEPPKPTYTTPSTAKGSKAKLDPSPAPEEPASSYTDLEVSRYLSCIIQLKDHINYLNILMDNVLDALDHFRIELNTKFTEYKTVRQAYERYDGDRFDFDMRLKSMIKVLEEALYKNTDAITQFANITGHQRSAFASHKLNASLALVSAWTPKVPAEMSRDTTATRKGRTEVRKGRAEDSRENVVESPRNEGEEEEEKTGGSMEKERQDELKILRQENKCIKEEAKRTKEKKRKYKRLLRESNDNVKTLTHVNNQYDSQLIETQKERERVKEELETKLKQLLVFRQNDHRG